MNVNEDGDVVVNGNSYDTGVAEAGMSLLRNSRSDIDFRDAVINRMGEQYGGDRDIDDVLGYPDVIEAEDYRAKYERLDVATRIVELPADDTWRQAPTVVDDDSDDDTFEEAIRKLDQQQRFYHYLRRVDVVSGIGEYGLLLIGLHDGQPLDEPPAEGNIESVDDVAYLTPFAQDHVEDWELGKHEENGDHNQPGDPRYSKPVKYQLDFNAFLDDEDIPQGRDEHDYQWVHWKRIIHVAEDKTENDLRGTPRMKPVYNRLIDYEKVIGASAEMFWTGAAPRFHFNIDTETDFDVPREELENLDEEVTKFVHDMQTYLKTFNTDVQVIGGEEVDPTGVLDNLYAAFSGQTGIPQRILKGSERGELASSQDRANWFDRVRTRQNRFAEPEILRDTIDRLIMLGAIPEPTDGTYDVTWENLFELNKKEQSQVMTNRAQVMQTIAPRANTDLLPGDFTDWLNFVKTGEIPESALEGSGPSREELEAMNVSHEQFDAAFNELKAGDKVKVDGTEAVISGVIEQNFTDPDDEEREASSDNPMYVVATAEDGMLFLREDGISAESWDSGVDAEGALKDAASQSNNIVPNSYRELEMPHVFSVNDIPGIDDPGIGFEDWPPSWEESEKPARLIALDAWSSMGGQFDCGGACCKGTMLQGGMSNREANQFCAAFKDEIFMTEAWRSIGI